MALQSRWPPARQFGGRDNDTARVVYTLKGRVPIIVDGGVHRGQDVFRALALGASVVALGRPTLYGAARGGAQGVQTVHEHLKNELMMVMRLAGTPNINSINRNFVERPRSTDVALRSRAAGAGT